MSLITTDEAKTYLRVDSSMEDGLIDSLLLTAEKLCADVGRMSAGEWSLLCDEDTEEMSIRGTDILVGEILQLRSLMRTAVLYALGYLYEHREEADHHDLVMTLRNLLSSVREGVF
jgi:hypothetical protein